MPHFIRASDNSDNLSPRSLESSDLDECGRSNREIPASPYFSPGVFCGRQLRSEWPPGGELLFSLARGE
jgi:hypothetical protein